MAFPTIIHIDDVLPFVEDKKEFNVTHRDECITIDYVFQDENTFSHPILKECRGIKFDKDTGFVKARPLHKFFNHGEQKDEETGRDFNKALMFEKLDGSFLHFIEHNGEIRACTKAGITEVSEKAERELKLSDKFLEHMRGFINSGVTVCFEYISPNNRIVIRYDQPMLVLLAVRDNTTGDYLQDIDSFSRTLNVPTAKTYNDVSIENVKEWKDREGVVMVWPDGYRLKLKADDYVLKHKVKDQLFRENNVLQMVLNDQTDDLVGIIDDEDYQKVVVYKHNVIENITKCADFIKDKVDQVNGMERKDVAMMMTKELPKTHLPIFWQVYDGKPAIDVVKNYLLKNCSKQAKVDEMRPIIGCEWSI